MPLRARIGHQSVKKTHNSINTNRKAFLSTDMEISSNSTREQSKWEKKYHYFFWILFPKTKMDFFEKFI
jgi:hypothetical protein